jgi:Domain of unknown function (DUF4386)
MNADKKLARIAGILYLIVIVTGMFAELFVRSNLIVPGNAAATASNIMASPGLFQLGILSDLISQTCFFLTAVALYLLLRPVNKNLALLFLSCVVIGVAILCLNMLNQFAAILIVNHATDYLKPFSSDQLQALSLLFLELHKYGYLIAGIFYGGWLLPLGFVVLKSGYFPKALGVLLMAATFGHWIGVVIELFLPSFKAVTLPAYAIASIAEVSFCLWLLIRGANLGHQNNRV